jgi:hypothetical protein
MVADAKFRKIGDTDLEVALSRNGRQVCIRKGREPGKSIITSAESWVDFINGVRAGKLDH